MDTPSWKEATACADTCSVAVEFLLASDTTAGPSGAGVHTCPPFPRLYFRPVFFPNLMISSLVGEQQHLRSTKEMQRDLGKGPGRGYFYHGASRNVAVLSVLERQEEEGLVWPLVFSCTSTFTGKGVTLYPRRRSCLPSKCSR